jgi:hypothetical protein
MSEHSEHTISLRDLAQMWELHDPMPEDLVEKVLVAIETEELDAKYEWLHLTERSRELVGARGDGEALTIAFSGGSFSLLLRVSELGGKHCRIDGWVTPAQTMRVTVTQHDTTQEAEVDARGRFEIPRMPTGLTRFFLRAQDNADPAEGMFATPTFEL